MEQKHHYHHKISSPNFRHGASRTIPPCVDAPEKQYRINVEFYLPTQNGNNVMDVLSYTRYLFALQTPD